ncbi:16.9 kDa class I heat shock protein 3-like [Syzygium oleosum]|uniref:16.9 kDa class I heat shock protein 3-like n=1 Tax=Syzygium oleosum TaxID=219896 RepID=UPI0011D218D1|nr:16.9 kDa class I heat shock protein 3-like [Syzygium oleosum]
MAGITGRTRSKDRTVEVFKPASGWVEESNCHYLLVDLPDFKKEDIKIQTDSIDHVTVSGERLLDNKYIYFEETFRVPEDSDIQKTSGRLEDGILSVTVPKRDTTVVEKEETEHHEQELNKESHGEAHEPPERKVRGRKSSTECCYSSEEIIKKWGEERSIFRSAMKMLNRNRGVIITAVLAFSLGVWVSGKFNLGGHEEALE